MKPSPRAILARNVMRLREARGWSQTQLGRTAGLPQTTISAIERASVDAGIDKLELLARAFKLPLWALLLPDVDEALFGGDGLGDVVAIYPNLPSDGRAEVLRVAEREYRYNAALAKPTPDLS
jgi:transcriptional regulator with XRE-family HTH domain